MVTLLYARPLHPELGLADVELTTRREVQEGDGRTTMAHSVVLRSVSRKVGEMLDMTPAGEPVQVGGWFLFTTLLDALCLLYDGYLNVGSEAADDVDDLICMLRGQRNLYRVTGQQGQAAANEQ